MIMNETSPVSTPVAAGKANGPIKTEKVTQSSLSPRLDKTGTPEVRQPKRPSLFRKRDVRKTSVSPPKDKKNNKKILGREKKLATQLFVDDEFVPHMFANVLKKMTGTNDVVDNVNDITKKVQETLTPEFLASLGSSAANIERVTASLADISPEDLKSLVDAPAQLTTMLSSVMEFMSSGSKMIGTVSMLASVACVIMWFHLREKQYLIAGSVCGVVALVTNSFSSHVSEWLLLINSFKDKEEKIVPQISIASINQLAGVGVAALAGLVGYTDARANIAKLAWEYFDKKDRMTKSFGDVISTILGFFQYLFDKFAEYFPGMATYRFVSTALPDIDTYLGRVDDFKTQVELGEISFTQTSYDRVKTLHKEGEQMLLRVPKGEQSMQIYGLIRSRIIWLEKRRAEFASSNFAGDGMRPEPVCLLIRGDPGTGKSQLLQFLHNAVCAATLPPEMMEEFGKNPDKFMYERQMEAEYWDRYDNNKWTCLFDDLGQIRDEVGAADGEWMNLIRAVNPFPYPLHMAKIEDKSNTYFMSRFVFCTTNVRDHFDIQSITSDKAIVRRFDYEITCSFDTSKTILENGVLKFDPEKLPKNALGETIFTEEVPLLRLALGNGNCTHITFKALVDLLLIKYRHKNRVYETKLPELKRIREEYIRKNTLSSQYKYEQADVIKPHLEVECLYYEEGETSVYHTDSGHSASASDSESSEDPVIPDWLTILDREQCLVEPFDSDLESMMDENYSILNDYFVFTTAEIDALEAEPGVKEFIAGLLSIQLQTEEMTVIERLDEVAKAIEEFYYDDLKGFNKIPHALVSIFKLFGIRSIDILSKIDDNEWEECMATWWASNMSHVMALKVTEVKLPKWNLRVFKERMTAWLSRFKDTAGILLYDWYNYVLKYKSIILIIGEILFCSAAGYTAGKLIMHCYRAMFPKTEILEANSIGLSDRMRSTGAVRDRLQDVRQKLATIKPHMAESYDPGAWQRMSKIVDKNCYVFSYADVNGTFSKKGYVMFVGERTGICPAHYISRLIDMVNPPKATPEEMEVALKNLDRKIRFDRYLDGKTHSIYCTFGQFLSNADVLHPMHDLAYFSLDSAVCAAHPNITKAFITEKQMLKMEYVTIMMPEPSVNRVVHTTQAKLRTDFPVDYGDRKSVV